MLRAKRWLALALGMLLCAPATAFAQGDPDGAFFVDIGAARYGFGGFRDTSTGAGGLRAAFGEPSSQQSHFEGSGCELRWAAIGVTVSTTSYGQDEIEACANGYFLDAVLRDRRWRTARGVGPGVSAAKARRASRRTCTKAKCGEVGYALGLARSECAQGLWPTVIARVAKGRVTALVVRSRGCE